MNSAVDKLLLSCSIKYPSISLRSTLEALADADSLTSPVNIGKLLHTVIMHSKHARWAFHYPNLMSIPIDAKEIMDIGSLLRRSYENALRFRHEEVTEMHLLLAILESRPADVATALSRVITEQREVYPQGTQREQTMLNFAISQGRPDWVAETQRRIRETPYSVGRVHETVLKYLSSRYCPYGSHQWNKFRRDYPRYDNLAGEPAEIQGAYLRFLDNGFGVTHRDRKS